MNEKISCIAIDDEPLGLKLVENYILKNSSLELLGTYTDALAAREWLAQNKVDLLFLDIQMPDITGIQLFRNLDEKPMVIFTTAYRNYAVEGFDLNAIDYLVKPFEYDRFEQAVQKAVDFSIYSKHKTENPDFIYLKYDYQWNKIQLSDIAYIEALDDYIKLHISPKPVLIHMSMKMMQEKLSPAQFLRIHRSYIVPLNRVNSWNKNNIIVEGKEFPISTTYQKEVQNVLEKLV